MNAIASQITSLTIVYSSDYSGTDQRKYQSFASLAFVRGIHRGPVNSPHKGPVTRKMFPFDDVIMRNQTVPLNQVAAASKATYELLFLSDSGVLWRLIAPVYFGNISLDIIIPRILILNHKWHRGVSSQIWRKPLTDSWDHHVLS